MNVVQRRNVIDHHHAGLRYRLLSCSLSLPELCQHRRILTAIVERSNLHVIKRKLATPQCSPPTHQRLHLLQIQHPLTVIALALIPDRATNRKSRQHVDHPVVQHCRSRIALKRSQLRRKCRTGTHLRPRLQALTSPLQPGFRCFEVRPQPRFILRGSRSPADDRLRNVRQRGNLLKTHRRSPRLNPSPTPGRIHQANRHIQFLMQPPRHVVAAGCEPSHCLR